MDLLLRLASLVVLTISAALAPAQAQEASLVTLKTPRGAKQAFILIKPKDPVAAVVLFAGGKGALGLKSASTMNWGKGNFLVRTRGQFAAHKLMVAVMDAPSDKQKGMNAEFRMSGAHAGDIRAVVSYLKKQANVPVWLVGTSMGTFSAAAGGVAERDIDGIVLTSTITRSHRDWNIARTHPDGVASMPLQKITVPALIVSHAKDACDLTPAADAPKLRRKLTKAKAVDVVMLDGGDPPRSEPCQAYAQHGFVGIEKQAVDTIAKFIAANSN